ncbi:unnamed protein product [Heterobilharzia americana]|nr:unnamed protein product [Heterobilharzia americana]
MEIVQMDFYLPHNLMYDFQTMVTCCSLSTIDKYSCLLKHVVLSAGGIGITTSPHDSLIHYYCNLKLHINIDFGPSTESLRRIQTVRQDTFERQIDFFVQASNMLKARSSSEFVCNLQFTRLNQLEDFWADYQSGALRSYLMLTLKSQPNKCFFGEPPQLVSNQSVSSSSVSEQHNIVDIVEENHSANAVVNASQNLVGNNSNVMANGVGLVNASFIDPPEYSHQNPVHSATSSSLNMAKDEDSLNMLASSIETLHRTFQRMTRRELVTTLSLSSDQLDEFTKFELNLFVSRREYENGRCLLMRNLRAIPSLCQLASVSSLIPSVDSISTRL